MTLINTCMITPEEGEMFKKELNKLPTKGRLLELGTGMGHASVFFAETKPNWSIYTIDGYGIFGDIENLFNRSGNELDVSSLKITYEYIKNTKNIIPIIGNTATLDWELPIDALFVDADHSFDWVKKDTEHYINFIVKGGLIMYHDYNYNWGVKEYFDKEMVGREGWKTWTKDGLAFAKKL